MRMLLTVAVAVAVSEIAVLTTSIYLHRGPLLTKPVDAEDLLAAVQRSVRGARRI